MGRPDAVWTAVVTDSVSADVVLSPRCRALSNISYGDGGWNLPDLSPTPSAAKWAETGLSAWRWVLQRQKELGGTPTALPPRKPGVGCISARYRLRPAATFLII
jgi:hypothetical protein